MIPVAQVIADLCEVHKKNADALGVLHAKLSAGDSEDRNLFDRKKRGVESLESAIHYLTEYSKLKPKSNE